MFLVILLSVTLLIPSQGLLFPEKCESQEDCKEDECCVTRFFYPRCEKRRQEGQHCLMHHETGVGKTGVYYLLCPCASGLKCVAEKVDDHNGTIIYHNSKCTKEESSEEESTEGFFF